MSNYFTTALPADGPTGNSDPQTMSPQTTAEAIRIDTLRDAAAFEGMPGLLSQESMEKKQRRPRQSEETFEGMPGLVPQESMEKKQRRRRHSEKEKAAALIIKKHDAAAAATKARKAMNRKKRKAAAKKTPGTALNLSSCPGAKGNITNIVINGRFTQRNSMEVDGGDSGDGASVVFSLYRLLAFMGDMCTLTGKFPAAFLSLPAMRDEATGLQWPAITATIFARGSFLIMGFNQIADIDMAVVHLDYWINKAFSGAGGPYKVASSEVVNIATSVSLAGRLPLGPFMHWIANGHADKILVEYEPSIFPAAFITVLGDYWYNKERDIAAKKAEQLLAKKRRDAAAALPAGQMPRRRRRSTTKKPKNAKKIKLKRSLFFGTGKVIIVGQRNVEDVERIFEELWAIAGEYLTEYWQRQKRKRKRPTEDSADATTSDPPVTKKRASL